MKWPPCGGSSSCAVQTDHVKSFHAIFVAATGSDVETTSTIHKNVVQSITVSS